jgi:hypothetical protein
LQEKELDFAFLAVVDLQQSRSDLIICGAGEAKLATVAYKGDLSR